LRLCGTIVLGVASGFLRSQGDFWRFVRRTLI
jgi:hypothetical protein